MKACKCCLTLLLTLCTLLACTRAVDRVPIVPSAVGGCAYVNGNYLPLEGTQEVTFSEGLCAVRIGDLWGYINTAGKLVIEPAFDAAGFPSPF